MHYSKYEVFLTCRGVKQSDRHRWLTLRKHPGFILSSDGYLKLVSILLSHHVGGRMDWWCITFLFVIMKYQRRCPCTKMNGTVFFWSNYLPDVALGTLSPPLLFPCSCHQSFWWEYAQFPSKIDKVSPACKTHSASIVRESFFDQEAFTVREGLWTKGFCITHSPFNTIKYD